ncbi:TPM domain-containing protein [Olivibacter domesticus]|uniref:TLP18.3, Psb32 and MOLO-1 founding protein of phosphatase n=1 Tax=Olivibacter domesticus TaxID=407022 RepID=A0A1H7GQT6_OLID1|nr:TPM domain-containing protein [Olivibacter domesticus]SEK40468.1 TLP18.3, Psb32 and MOLO-1 founding protein of phosphatase [Olivibacter domesticus]
MRYLLIILCYCFLATTLLAQETPAPQPFVIKKDRIIDHEHIFTSSEIQQLDSMVSQCWEKGVAEIAIVTIDDRHTNKENFDNYVFNNLTSYASGEHGKNNGIVIAISKKLRQMRIENGYGIEKMLSNAATKKIIDEQFIPKFKDGNYFEGTLNGLNTIISYVEKAMKEEDFTIVSSIFTPSIFKKIRTFVLENGSPQTFRNLDSDNPSYHFTSLDVFLGPSRKQSFVLKDFREEDYYEMTIRDNDGSQYQFVYFEKPTPEQTFIHPKMQPEKVYWWHPGKKFLSSDVWPLLAQIEDEIAQNSAVKNGKIFTGYQWILKQEFHPMERTYTAVDPNDTLSFQENHFSINGKEAGTFNIDSAEHILALKTYSGKQPAFAIFKMNDYYNYHYHFNKKERRLYLVPLDEQEGNDLICVEGCTLLFEILEK